VFLEVPPGVKELNVRSLEEDSQPVGLPPGRWSAHQSSAKRRSTTV